MGDSQRPFRLDVPDRVAVEVAPVARVRRGCGHMAVRQDAVHQRRRPGHPGVADVDHVRVLVVQPQPEAHERERQPDQKQQVPVADVELARLPVPADPHHPHGQIDHRRIDERRRPEDVALVERVERRHERQHHHQVEGAHGARPPPVDQPRQEERAHRPQHIRGVDLPPVGLRLSAGELPRHLRAGPHLVGVRGVVGDVHLGDLVAGGVVVDRPDAVVAERAAVADVLVLREPLADLRLAGGDRRRLHGVQARLPDGRGDVDAGDGAAAVRDRERGQDVVGAGGLEQHRPGAGAGVVLGLPVGTGILQPQRRSLRLRLGDPDRLVCVQARRGLGGRGRDEHGHDRHQRGATETSRACCQGS